MGLSVFGQVVVGPFNIPLLKPVCLKVAAAVCFYQEKRGSWEGCYKLESTGVTQELEVWWLLVAGALPRQKDSKVEQGQDLVRSSPSLPVGSAW